MKKKIIKHLKGDIKEFDKEKKEDKKLISKLEKKGNMCLSCCKNSKSNKSAKRKKN